MSQLNYIINNMDKDITDVIFRKEKDNNVIAVFPYIISDSTGNVTCYSHVGQHSSMSWEYFFETIPCRNKHDFIGLYDELVLLGYNLNVIQKRSIKRYMKVYYETKERNSKAKI